MTEFNVEDAYESHLKDHNDIGVVAAVATEEETGNVGSIDSNDAQQMKSNFPKQIQKLQSHLIPMLQ